MTTTTARKKRSPRRAPLDRERIEQAALELIEQDGLADFSMRKLGAAVGVEAMSLYHHYPSKAHLLDALLDRLITQVTDVADPSLPWQERVRVATKAYRELGLRYPKFAQFLIVHRMNTRAGLRWLESVVRIFAEAGFDTASAARAFRIIAYFVMGAVLDETAGYAQGPSAADPVDAAEQAAIAPTATSFGPYFAKEHWEATFDTGLDLLLAELERQRVAALGNRQSPRQSG